MSHKKSITRKATIKTRRKARKRTVPPELKHLAALFKPSPKFTKECAKLPRGSMARMLAQLLIPQVDDMQGLFEKLSNETLGLPCPPPAYWLLFYRQHRVFSGLLDFLKPGSAEQLERNCSRAMLDQVLAAVPEGDLAGHLAQRVGEEYRKGAKLKPSKREKYRHFGACMLHFLVTVAIPCVLVHDDSIHGLFHKARKTKGDLQAFVHLLQLDKRALVLDDKLELRWYAIMSGNNATQRGLLADAIKGPPISSQAVDPLRMRIRVAGIIDAVARAYDGRAIKAKKLHELFDAAAQDRGDPHDLHLKKAKADSFRKSIDRERAGIQKSLGIKPTPTRSRAVKPDKD